MLTEADLVAIVERLERAGVDYRLDGGWGIDALAGVQTRPHDDLDLMAPRAQLAAVRAALPELAVDEQARPGMPSRLVLRSAGGLQVDVHPVVFDERGDAWQELPDGLDGHYPAEGLAGEGRLAGRPVPCIAAALQLRFHGLYEPDLVDYHDVLVLAAVSGLAPPPGYEREPRWVHRRREAAVRELLGPAAPWTPLDGDRFAVPPGLSARLAAARQAASD